MYFNSDRGFFGEFGGSYVPEILHDTLAELEEAYQACRADQKFWQQYLAELESYAGRPTPLTFCRNLTAHFGGAQIYLKREDLNHTGAHKVANVIGQGLLTTRMGKRRVIAETGAGQHGMAAAIMAARLGLEAKIYMGAKDVARQYPNVFWMRQLGAEVVPVTEGNATLKDAIDEALRDWAASFPDTHYVLGTACGPHPFPEMVAWFTSVIGTEARAQVLSASGRLPTAVYAVVGGGSNAAGIFGAFLADTAVRLVGVEAGGKGVASGEHAARLVSEDSAVGVTQGYKTIFLQTSDGQMRATHSIAAGVDYTGISPLLADLHRQGRLEAYAAEDEAVIAATRLIMKHEGIIPALESAHALVQAFADAPRLASDDVLVINLSGRGDKDIFGIAAAFEDGPWRDFLRERAGD